jgi:hypothetical protein
VIKKMKSAAPLTAVLGWFYFVVFVFVEAFHGGFAIQGQIQLGTLDSLMMAGTTALSVGAKPWYLQLPLSLEFVLVGLMYWAFGRLLEERKEDGHGSRHRGRAFALLIALSALAVASLLLAHQQGAAAARQVRTHFTRDGGGLRTLYIANGRHVVVGPVLGCDDVACGYLARGGSVVLRRESIEADVPRPRPD